MRKFLKFRSYNKILKYLSVPLVTALIISLVYLITNLFLSGNNEFNTSVKNAAGELVNIFPLIISPFLTYCFAKQQKALCAFVSLISVLLLDSIFFSITNCRCSLLVPIFLGIAIPIVFNLFDNFKLTSVLTVVVTVILALLLSLIFPYYNDLLIFLANKISKSLFVPFWFGLVKNITMLLPGKNLFENLFFERSYGGAIYYANDFITGAKNIFLNEIINNNSINSNASKYLSGNYIVSIFFVIGSSISLYSNMREEKKKSNLLFFITLLTIMTGNILPYCIFLLFLNPALLLLLLGVSGISYLICSLLAVNIGYQIYGGLIEYAYYAGRCSLRDAMMIMITGFVIAIMSYSVVKLFISKFGVSADINETAIDSEFVKSLGGINNIESIKSFKGKIVVEVKNQNTMDLMYLNSHNYSVSSNKIVAKFKDYDEYNEFYDKIILLKKYI